MSLGLLKLKVFLRASGKELQGTGWAGRTGSWRRTKRLAQNSPREQGFLFFRTEKVVSAHEGMQEGCGQEKLGGRL